MKPSQKCFSFTSSTPLPSYHIRLYFRYRNSLIPLTFQCRYRHGVKRICRLIVTKRVRKLCQQFMKRSHILFPPLPVPISSIVPRDHHGIFARIRAKTASFVSPIAVSLFFQSSVHSDSCVAVQVSRGSERRRYWCSRRRFFHSGKQIIHVAFGPMHPDPQSRSWPPCRYIVRLFVPLFVLCQDFS